MKKNAVKNKPSVSALQHMPVLSVNLLVPQVGFNLLIPATLLPRSHLSILFSFLCPLHVEQVTIN